MELNRHLVREVIENNYPEIKRVLRVELKPFYITYIEGHYIYIFDDEYLWKNEPGVANQEAERGSIEFDHIGFYYILDKYVK